MGIMTGSGFNR